MARMYSLGAAAVIVALCVVRCDGLWVDGLPGGVVVQDPGTVNMVPVPAGPFWMGCNESVDGDCANHERPYHEVTLDAFEIDETEVTVASYAACVQAGGCTEPGSGGQCNWGKADRASYPVNCVDWSQANAYCAFAGKRLPTESEWEKAARGPDGAVYPWGNGAASCMLAVYGDCGSDGTLPVGSRPLGVSPYGALDMAGNVLEWVSDWYDSNYYVSFPAPNPQGPGSGSGRVVRGGDFGSHAHGLRASRRVDFVPSYSNRDLGLRCCRSVP